MNNRPNPSRRLRTGWQQTLIQFVLLAYFFVTTLSSLFYRISFTEICLGIVIYLVSIYPLLRWVRQRNKPLPLMELYMLFYLLYYVHPILATNVNYGMWTEDIRIKTSVVVLLYIVSFEVVYFLCRRQRPFRPNRFLDKRLPLSSSSWSIWLMLLFWVFLTALQVSGITFGGNVQVVVAKAAALLSLFYLGVDFGAGRLPMMLRVVFMALATFGIALQCAGGFLNAGAASMIVFLLGYSLGAQKVPLFSVVLGFAFFSYLNLGKSEMRDRFWTIEQGQGVAVTPANFLEICRFWNSASWEALTKQEIRPEQPLLSRLNLFQMVALVVDTMPGQRDYLHGETYSSYPSLFIPRFLWPNKPRVDGPSQTLAYATGIQTEETAETTAISFGVLSEAWANFGWYGMPALGCFMALIVTFADWICAARRIDSIGFIIGVSVLSSLTSFELVLGQWLLNLVQLCALAVLAALLMSKIVPAPAASRRVPARSAA